MRGEGIRHHVVVGSRPAGTHRHTGRHPHSVEPSLANQQYCRNRDQQYGSLQEQGGSVDDHGAHDRGATCSREQDDSNECRRETTEAENEMTRVPGPARQEGLDEHGGHGDAEHDEHRGKLAVLDVRGGQRRTLGEEGVGTPDPRCTSTHG